MEKSVRVLDDFLFFTMFVFEMIIEISSKKFVGSLSTTSHIAGPVRGGVRVIDV